MHHERAKTLLRFALFSTRDSDLTEKLKNTSTRAKKEPLVDAGNALTAARKYLEPGSSTGETNLAITEARVHLIAKEFEESARIARRALDFARKSHSLQSVEEVKQLYVVLHQLAPTNPYIAHLGVELRIFPEA